jgi:integrase
MSRNSNGAGTVYKRRDGRYEGAIYLPTVGGARKRFRCYGRSPEEVRAKLVAQQSLVLHGSFLPERTWQLGDYLDYWLATVVRVNRRPKTYESYEATVRRYIKPNLGAARLQRLSVVQLQTYLNGELAAGCSIRTAHLIRMVLSAALTRAMREELLHRNVARLVELPAWHRKDITPWTAAQVAEFLAAAKLDPLYPAFLLLAMYGLRRGEVLGLRWGDIDATNQQIHVRQQIQRIDGRLQTGLLKTSAGRRDLPLLPAVWAALDQHAQRMQAEVQAESRQPAADDLIFTTRNGQPVEPHNLLRSFTRIRTEQGLPHNTLHHLRHTTATLLKNAGVPPRDAQLILGHAHISTTQQIYQHADPIGQRRGLMQVEGVLLAAPDGLRCRQPLPSGTGAKVQFLSFKSGGPSETRTHDTLLKSCTSRISSQGLSEIRQVQRRRYHSLLLGAAAVMFSRQPRGPNLAAA